MALCCGTAFWLKQKEDKVAEAQQFVRVEEAQTVFRNQTVREVEMTQTAIN